jgi:hypothetical protein
VSFTNGAVYEGRFRGDAIDGQGTMKMSRAIIVPRDSSSDKDHINPLDDGEAELNAKDTNNNDGDEPAPEKDDFMIPVFFQSDMGHIHRKAGFTHGGK